MTDTDRLNNAVAALSDAMSALQALAPDTDAEDDPVALAWQAVDAVQTDLLEIAGQLDPAFDSPYADYAPMHRLASRGDI